MSSIRLNLEADLHVHTLASGHAYSTIKEIAMSASLKKLKAVAITDHGPAMPGGAHRYHFGNLKILPDKIENVRIIRGVELNILNESGEVDLPPRYLSLLDFAWAGLHALCYDGTGSESYTKAVIQALQNPYVDGIVHPGNPDFALDAKAVVREAKKQGKLLEINNSSFHVRLGSLEPCLKFAKLAAEYELSVAVNSDAHYADDVGRHEQAAEVLLQADLDTRLVVNSSFSMVQELLLARKTRIKKIV